MNERFAKHIEQGKRPLFIPFITAGDPAPEVTVDLAVLLQNAGANAIELGIPYSDPLADGPVIQRASNRALKQGMTLKKAMELAGAMRRKGVQIPIVVFTYYNLLLQLGKEQFFALARENEIDGLLVPDLPFEESDELREAAESENLPLITLIAPTTSRERVKKIALHQQGFTYCVSSLGVTGERKGKFKQEVYDFLANVKRHSPVPVVVGFGISGAEQVERLQEYCDGVVVGSAIVREIEKHQDALLDINRKAEALKQLKDFLTSLTGRKLTT